MRISQDSPLPDLATAQGAAPRRLLTVREVAEILQVHPKTVLRLTRSEGLPCLRLQARLRFDPADVVRWVSARKEG